MLSTSYEQLQRLPLVHRPSSRKIPVVTENRPIIT